MSKRTTKKPADFNPADYWPCACVKRDKEGNMTHVGINHKSLKRCPTCKATRPPQPAAAGA